MKHQKILVILFFTVCSALCVNATDLGSILGPLLMTKQGLLGSAKSGVNSGFDAKSGLLKSLQGAFSGLAGGGSGLFGSSKSSMKQSLDFGKDTAGEYTAGSSSSGHSSSSQYASNGGYNYAPNPSNSGYHYERPPPVKGEYATSSHNAHVSEHSSGFSSKSEHSKDSSSTLGSSSGLNIGNLFGSIGLVSELIITCRQKIF